MIEPQPHKSRQTITVIKLSRGISNMPSSNSEGISLEELSMLAQRSGVSLTHEELEQMKPIHDLYSEMIDLIHSVDLGDEESGVCFKPDWV